MKYIITKTINKRFTYYLGVDGVWEGLVDNAIQFKDKDSAYDNRLKLKKLFPNTRFGLMAV